MSKERGEARRMKMEVVGEHLRDLQLAHDSEGDVIDDPGAGGIGSKVMLPCRYQILMGGMNQQIVALKLEPQSFACSERRPRQSVAALQQNM